MKHLALVRTLPGAIAFTLGPGLVGAVAGPVNATLAARYFEVAAGTGGPDFGGAGTPNALAGSLLGPDGLPVLDSTNPGVTEFDSISSRGGARARIPP